jgi:hypothetical protein
MIVIKTFLALPQIRKTFHERKRERKERGDLVLIAKDPGCLRIKSARPPFITAINHGI